MSKQEFIKIKADEKSFSMRNPICGIGINDSWYKTRPKINGVFVTCKVYVKWYSMIGRCYSENIHVKHPTYKDCTVCDEWLTFSNFAKWYEENCIDGFELDKDLKFKSNKIYSPENCLFVPKSINLLLTKSKNYKDSLPQGVCFFKRDNNYKSQISIDGKHTHIGYYETPEQASDAYKIAKNKELDRKSIQYPELSQFIQQHKI